MASGVEELLEMLFEMVDEAKNVPDRKSTRLNSSHDN